MLKLFLCILLILIPYSFLTSSNIPDEKENMKEEVPSVKEDAKYSISEGLFNKFSFKNQNNINRFFPGVVSYFQDFYIRGGQSSETGFFIDGVKINDHFSGDNSFFINTNSIDKIDFYPGFIPVEFGNVSSGLFNYKLKTGGKELQLGFEHINDNITFTNDPFSGNKRLGAYFYGYNETNINVGGPLFLDDIRFFINANYLFQRDKNPQRYPGADNVFFQDTPNSINIDLPAGIVPLNSLESLNLISTFLFSFDKIEIKFSGIYFNENTFEGRQHIIQYLNPRAGLKKKTGALLNMNINHKINDFISYSVGGNYFTMKETTNDQYLGDRYWSYGDSAANAEAGMVWPKQSDFPSRFYSFSPTIIIMPFEAPGFPGIDHEKSEQARFSLKGNILFSFNNFSTSIGGEYQNSRIRHWSFTGQYQLTNLFLMERASPDNQNLSDNALKERILSLSRINNFGFDFIGNETDDGLYAAPDPVILSFFIDNKVIITDKLSLYTGLKFENYTFDYKKLKDPSLPDLAIENFSPINENGLTDKEDVNFWLPKVQLQYYFLDNLYSSLIYSKASQNHQFNYLYQGYNLMSYIIRGGFSNFIIPGDLKPIISDLYEINIDYLPKENIKIGLSFYIKEIKNQLSIENQIPKPSSSYIIYPYYGTNTKTDVNGIDLFLQYDEDWFSLFSSFSYQNARTNDNLIKIQRVPDPVYNISPEFEKNNKIFIKTLFNYNFLHLYSISSFFRNFNLALLHSFNSGHPYVRRNRIDNSTLFSSETTPNVSQLDMKLEKIFSLYKYVELGIYLYIINIFDTKNVNNLFTNTGSTETNHDQSYLDQMDEFYGNQYTQLDRLINAYNPNNQQQEFFGSPRQIGFGIFLNL